MDDGEDAVWKVSSEGKAGNSINPARPRGEQGKGRPSPLGELRLREFWTALPTVRIQGNGETQLLPVEREDSREQSKSFSVESRTRPSPLGAAGLRGCLPLKENSRQVIL